MVTVDAVVRPLKPDDLDGAFQLSSTAGWNQRVDDWRMLLSIAPNGSFAAILADRIIGTAIGIDYGGFAWIAMMLVDPAYRGHGLGARLLEAAMNGVPADRTIRLDATPMGRPLYQRHGFKDETTLTRFVAEASSRSVTATPGARRLTATDLRDLAADDREVFGGERKRVFEWSLADAPYARAVAPSKGLDGYCFGRRGRLFDQVGPVVARSEKDARALVVSAVGAVTDRSAAVDAFDTHPGFVEWLRDSGFRPERPLFRMRRGPVDGSSIDVGPPPRTGLREFAIFGPEFG